MPDQVNHLAQTVFSAENPSANLTEKGRIEVIAQISEIVGSRLTTEELVSLLATPQVLLRDYSGEPMTPFAALERGEAERVIDFVRWVVTPPDDDAPDVAAAGRTAP